MTPPAAVSEKCAGCMKLITSKDFLRCVHCMKVYDLLCINMSPQRFYSFYKLDKGRRDSWRCPVCVCNIPKKGNQNTPVRPTHTPEPEIMPDDSSNVTQRVKVLDKPSSNSSLIEPYLDNSDNDSPQSSNIYLKQICEEMKAMRAEMVKFNSVVSDLAAALKLQTSRVDRLEDRVDILERNYQNCDISTIEETVVQLRLEIEERNQDLLANDVEIACFPETKNENTMHTVLTISKKLGVSLDERDVVSAWRVGAPRVQAEGAAARPRAIAVRLARRASRDALLQAARVRRRLSSADMDLPASESPAPHRLFYINERLTRYNRNVFQKSREAAKRLGWKYVWTREGNIFARQDTGKARHRLNSEADVVRVFGSNPVSEN